MAYQNLNLIAGNGMNIDLTDPNSPVFTTVPTNSGNRILSGGAVWSGTGYVYNVSALTYLLNGYNYSSAPTTATMATADPTNDRFDAIVVDNTGLVSVITGTPSANPIEPAIPDTVTLVQFVLVEHGTTQPTVTSETIYDENTEWNTSTVTFSGSPLGSTNFAATTPTPFHGTVCVNNVRDGYTADLFTRTTPLTTAPFTVLYMYVYFDAVVPSTKSLIVNFLNGSNQNVGNSVNLFAYGAQRNVINQWQLVVIPKTVFGAIPTVQKLRAYMAGGARGTLVNWNLDYINFTSGVAPVVSVPTVTVQQDGVNVGTESKLNFTNPSNASIPVTVVNDSVNGTVKITVGNSNFYFNPSTNQFYVGTSQNNLVMTPDTTVSGDNAVYRTTDFYQLLDPLGNIIIQATSPGYSGGYSFYTGNGTTTALGANNNGVIIRGDHVNHTSIASYANNAAAIAGGLNVGDEYYTNVGGDGILKVVI